MSIKQDSFSRLVESKRKGYKDVAIHVARGEGQRYGEHFAEYLTLQQFEKLSGVNDPVLRAFIGGVLDVKKEVDDKLAAQAAVELAAG